MGFADDEEQEEVVPPTEETQSFGTYSIREFEYDINYLSYIEGDTYYTFIISPQDGSSSLSKYVQFDVMKNLEGDSWNIKTDLGI